MKLRIGLVVGFVVGYVLGARAGRARYEQLRRRLERLRDSRVFDRLQAAVELGVERLRSDEADPSRSGTPIGTAPAVPGTTVDLTAGADAPTPSGPGSEVGAAH